MVITRRALCRVAMVAAEAGARFQREGVAEDPMGWMLSPRRVFNGAAALEACLDRTHFIRAVILHGLALGLDADPDVFDGLFDDEFGAHDEDLNVDLEQVAVRRASMSTSQKPCQRQNRRRGLLCQKSPAMAG